MCTVPCSRLQQCAAPQLHWQAICSVGMGQEGLQQRGAAGKGKGGGASGKKDGEQCALTWCRGQAQLSIHDILFHPSLFLSLCTPQLWGGAATPFPSLPLWQPSVTRNGKCHFLVKSPETPAG